MTPPDPVSTEAMKEMLNSLDPKTRGVLKAKLTAQGYALPLPGMLARNLYDKLDAILPELIKELVGDAAPTAN